MERLSMLGWLLLVGCSAAPGASDASSDGAPDASVEVADAATVTPPPDGGLAADAGSCVPPSAPEADVVMTGAGAVRGVRVEGVWEYKGIPYAAPPVGALRFRPPEPAACWSGVRDASRFGSACMQRQGAGVVGSEDCLTVNVWRPEGAGATPLPVMVFLHGGSNVAGTSSSNVLGVDLYSGGALAARGPVVVVTLNYRLGSLGFLTHLALGAESPRGVSGNYGLLDQLAALRWVQQNIRAFGGDPAQVTLFGHSAGAIDTCALVSSPLAAGLFSRAMVLSGTCGSFNRQTAEKGGRSVVQALGCANAPDVPACLRSASATAVTLAPAAFGPTEDDSGFNGHWVDGWVLPEPPLAAIRAGRHNHVPILLSTTEDEFRTLLGNYGLGPVADEAGFRAALAARFGAAAVDPIAARYPLGSYATPNDAWVAVLSDSWFICPTRAAARAFSAGQSEPVWRAHFTRGFAGGPLKPYRAGHGMDLWFGFHRLPFPAYAPTAEELSLQETLSSLWLRFATTGKVEASGFPTWPPFTADNDVHLIEDVPLVLGTGLHRNACDLWAP